MASLKSNQCSRIPETWVLLQAQASSSSHLMGLMDVSSTSLAFHGAFPGGGGHQRIGMPALFHCRPHPPGLPDLRKHAHPQASVCTAHKQGKGWQPLKTYVLTMICLGLLRNMVSNGIFEARGGIPLKWDFSKVSKWSSCLFLPTRAQDEWPSAMTNNATHTPNQPG